MPDPVVVDALYVALSGQLGAPLLTTDARLSRGADRVELVGDPAG